MIRINKHSGIFTLTSQQQLYVGIDKAWEFFASPGNLARITPSHMGFKITSGNIDKMYPGQIISYEIGIFPGIKVDWITEITHVSEGSYFIDEQRFGPYIMWHHEHFFEENEIGVMMKDKVSYKVPFGIIGRFANYLFIQKQLFNIFTYRNNKITELL